MSVGSGHITDITQLPPLSTSGSSPQRAKYSNAFKRHKQHCCWWRFRNIFASSWNPCINYLDKYYVRCCDIDVIMGFTKTHLNFG